MNNGSTSRVDDIDRIVSARLHLRRKELGLNQADLARTLEVTIQQIQKYEKAINRISVWNLYKLSNKLGVPLSYFFTEIDGVVCTQNTTSHTADCGEKELETLIKYYKKIHDDVVRKRLLDIMATLIQNDNKKNESIPMSE